MRPLLLIATLAAAVLPVRAQAPDSTGFSGLEAEVWDAPPPSRLYLSRLGDAWDRAVVARQFDRADSLVVLAEAAVVETQGLEEGSFVWPSAGDRLGVALLRGDPEVVENLAEDGAWWDWAERFGPADGPWGYEGPYGFTYRPWSLFLVRTPVRNVLVQDADLIAERMAVAGADPEAVEIARLTADRILTPLVWPIHSPTPFESVEQTALNEQADAFLARYPDSRFGRFVREVVRVRYREVASYTAYLGFGAGWGTSSLGEAADVTITSDIGIGLRRGLLHADLGLLGGDLTVRETREGRGATLVEGDRMSMYLLGASVGPRLSVGRLDILPHVSGGYLLQRVSAPSAEEPKLSTYEPANRLGWGYGVAIEVLGLPTPMGGYGIRVRATRLTPRFSDGFEDVLDGHVTSISVGFATTVISRARVVD